MGSSTGTSSRRTILVRGVGLRRAAVSVAYEFDDDVWACVADFPRSWRVLLADLGCAEPLLPAHRRAKPIPDPVRGEVVGTLWYRSPEFLLGNVGYGVGVDSRAAACALAELVMLEPLMGAAPSSTS